jgi:FlaG/FlaF family flagellin (archaellin)
MYPEYVLPGVYEPGTRAVSSVVATVLMVAIVVIVASVVGGYLFGATGSQSVSPQISVTHELVDAGTERSVAVTLQSGDSVRTDRLYVVGSVDLDIGSAPGTTGAADESYASGRETFTEAPPGDPPQVGIGETEDASETVYLGPVGSADGVTVGIYWTTESVRGINPGTPTGENTYKLAEFTTRS